MQTAEGEQKESREQQALQGITFFYRVKAHGSQVWCPACCKVPRALSDRQQGGCAHARRQLTGTQGFLQVYHL